MSLTPLLPDLNDPIESRGTKENRWMVTIYNNDHNNFGEVIGVLMRATQCSREEAEIETWEAHQYGKAPVHFADRGECEVTAEVISSIGVRTEVTPEWSD
jgi:ATP-dependent Clp protease adaptor protein ClpS